jgi:hypothetical protein
VIDGLIISVYQLHSISSAFLFSALASMKLACALSISAITLALASVFALYTFSIAIF